MSFTVGPFAESGLRQKTPNQKDALDGAPDVLGMQGKKKSPGAKQSSNYAGQAWFRVFTMARASIGGVQYGQQANFTSY